MKGWWRGILEERFIDGYQELRDWADRLPKPARDELVRLLLREKTAVGYTDADGISETWANYLADFRAFCLRNSYPEIVRGASRLQPTALIYLKETTP